MDVRCCKCKKGYDLGDNIFEYNKANCPILICPHCGFKHIINFMPFEKRIEVKKVEELDLATELVILGASKIADATRVDQSKVDDGDIYEGVAWDVNTFKYDAKSFSVTTEDIYPRDVSFKPDGDKMYMIGHGTKKVLQYTLSIPWDINSASYDGKFKSVTNEDDSP